MKIIFIHFTIVLRFEIITYYKKNPGECPLIDGIDILLTC